MSTEEQIMEVISSVAKEQKCAIISLADTVPLLESGLDSLCLAIIVARLEVLLGFDPFSQVEEADFPRTVGNFIRLYTERRRD